MDWMECRQLLPGGRVSGSAWVSRTSHRTVRRRGLRHHSAGRKVRSLAIPSEVEPERIVIAAHLEHR